MATPDKTPTLWACTCHHGDCSKQGDRLLAWTTYPALLSIWGHSYEFEEAKNWSLIEDFCTAQNVSVIGKVPQDPRIASRYAQGIAISLEQESYQDLFKGFLARITASLCGHH